MSGTALQPVWEIAPRITAQAIGLPFLQYRAISPTNPFASPIATIPVWITRDPTLMAAKPFDRAKPDEVYAALDVTQTQVGDYLVGAVAGGSADTFFIVSQDVPAPIRLTLCDRVLNFFRPGESVSGTFATGYVPSYGGREEQGNASGGGEPDTPLLTGWAASCVQGTKGETPSPSGRLPTDVRTPWWTMLLPAYPGIILHTGDRIEDDIQRAYTVSSAELTRFGWRVTAMEDET